MLRSVAVLTVTLLCTSALGQSEYTPSPGPLAFRGSVVLKLHSMAREGDLPTRVRCP